MLNAFLRGMCELQCMGRSLGCSSDTSLSEDDSVHFGFVIATPPFTHALAFRPSRGIPYRISTASLDYKPPVNIIQSVVLRYVRM